MYQLTSPHHCILIGWPVYGVSIIYSIAVPPRIQYSIPIPHLHLTFYGQGRCRY